MSTRVGHLLERGRFIKKHENSLQLALRNCLETHLLSVSLSLSLVSIRFYISSVCSLKGAGLGKEPSGYNNAADSRHTF